MQKTDRDVTAPPDAGNTHDDVGSINSCLLKYFKGSSDTLPSQGLEYSILAALSVYFQGYGKL